MNFRLTVGLVAVLSAKVALSQSFNIDLDVGSGSHGVGNGAPSSAFGGAAGSPGFWNRIYNGGPSSPVILNGLDGVATSRMLVATGGIGSGGGYDFHGNTGDYAFLLNDFSDFSRGEIDYHFSGFTPGRYQIVTYAVDPVGEVTTVRVTVPGADSPDQYVTGPMPGNRFIQGITHSVHDLTLSGDSFDIDVSAVHFGRCNGFQIVAVPEPSSILLLAIGGLGLTVRSKRFRLLRSPGRIMPSR